MAILFAGWRRNIGIFVLLLACVSMMTWIRSFHSDFLVGMSQHSLTSVRGGLIWETPTQRHSIQSANFIYASRSLSKFPLIGTEYDTAIPDDKWRRRWLGFVVAEYDVAVTPAAGATVILETNRFFRIPYWSITVPLTVLSAYLLLSKSTRPQPNNSERR